MDKNGFGDEILEKIKQWEKARMSGAFSADQKKRMENISDEFSLEKVSNNSWNLIPYSVQRFEHKLKIRQPGEPVWSSFTFKNDNETQPLQFILTTKSTSVSAITLEIDNFKKLQLNISIGQDQYLKYEGGKEAVLYDKSWNKIKSIPVDQEAMTLNKGVHEIKVDCKFSAKEEASLKLEMKTAGDKELVQMSEIP